MAKMQERDKKNEQLIQKGQQLSTKSLQRKNRKFPRAEGITPQTEKATKCPANTMKDCTREDREALKLGCAKAT